MVNHELGVTSYPPVEVGVPPSITLSEFSGWAPWAGYVLTLDLYKLAVAAGIVALAWLAWPRGTALTVPLRWRTGVRRAVGSAGALAAAAVVLAAGLHGVLREQLVTAARRPCTATCCGCRSTRAGTVHVDRRLAVLRADADRQRVARQRERLKRMFGSADTAERPEGER